MHKAILLISALVMTGLSAHSQQPAPGQQVEQELQTPNGTIPYLIYLPENYAASNAWPMMLFLHGRGESFGPLSIVKKWGPPSRVEKGYPLPYILVSPQCPTNESWAQPKQQDQLAALLKHIQATCKVDAARIYLAGLSMGGYGSWRLAADHPDWFAAVVPVCGGGNVADASKLVSLPIWVWHGTEDKAVPFQKSEEMVAAIKAAGGIRVKFTTLEEIGHNSWEAAFASPELYSWLDKQSAPQNRK